VLRFNSDGTIDTTFGSNGIRITNVSGQDSIRAIVLLQDGTGRIVVAGWSGPFGAHNFSLARYLSNGTLDTTFGTTGTGTVLTDFGADEQARGAALQTDGKIVVGGYSKTGSAARRRSSSPWPDTIRRISRHHVRHGRRGAQCPQSHPQQCEPWPSDGRQDRCLWIRGSTGGIVTTLGRAQIVRDPDLEAPRQGIGDFAVARYLSDGTWIRRSAPPASDSRSPTWAVPTTQGCSIQPDGKIVLGGNSSDPTGSTTRSRSSLQHGRVAGHELRLRRSRDDGPWRHR